MSSEVTQFQPGISGNPGGRPRGAVARDLARKLTPECFEVLAAALKNPKERLQAVVIILDRAWGKPKEQHENLNINVDAGGIDAPVAPETLEEWLQRRHSELKALT